jgi:hypothetical protein
MIWQIGFCRKLQILFLQIGREADDPARSDLAAAVGSRKICWSCHWKKLKDPARITKSSRRDPHGRRQLTRVNSTNILDEGLRIRGRATTRDSGIEIGTRCTQVHVPALEDRYILLAIYYMITMMFTWCRHRRSIVSSLCLIYLVYSISRCLSCQLSL